MLVRRSIRFYLNDEFVELHDVPAHRTVLDWLRLDRNLRGTKEGCAEGDCGACTILVGRLDGSGSLVYESINSCIRFLATLDGTHLVTIENLASDGHLHPIQKAMIECSGSQCGFCTPGVVMSLYAGWLEEPRTDDAGIDRNLQGNLCRCTGYEAIARAARAASDHGDPADDRLKSGAGDMAERLLALRDGARVVLEGGGYSAVLPADADDLARALIEAPDATIVSGATDVGLWITKQLRQPRSMVFLTHVDELDGVALDGDRLIIGARTSYSAAEEAIAAHLPQFGELWGRIGGRQVRNAGTIGGNIANGSPIGDTPPPLIALGAEVTLRRGDVRRTLPLEAFFIDYGRQDRQLGEFVESIAVPLPKAGDRIAAYKVSKRFDEDISSVLGAFRLRIAEGRVVEAVIAYGGMAATPKRASSVEAALIGRPWTRDTVERAMVAYAEDFAPLTDWRASAEYRATVARNLLLRFWSETTGHAETRVRELANG